MWQFEIGTRVQHINPDCIKEYGVIVDRKYDHKGQPYCRVKCDDGSYFNEHNPSYLLPCTNLEGANRQVIEQEAPSKTKSNGGSSDYYKLEINGNPVEVEDIIYAMVGGDFALGNVIKACRRMYLDSKGQGKEGVDMTYDANKIKFFVDSFEKRFGGKND